MNLTFPRLRPRLLDSHWFTADSPRDEDGDVTAMEQKYHSWLMTIGQKFVDVVPLGKVAPEPMEEEAESDDEEGNDDSEDTEDSHDEDEEEELGADYSPSGPTTTDANQTGGNVPAPTAANHPINNNDIVMNDSNVTM